jgi:hypothetical protein
MQALANELMMRDPCSMGRPLLNDSILVIIIPIHEAFLHMCYELGFSDETVQYMPRDCTKSSL